jgi:predicted secreted protein
MKSLILSLLLLVSGGITVTPALVHAEEITNRRVITLSINDANKYSPIEIALGDILEIELNNSGSIGYNCLFSNFSQDGVLSLNTPNNGVIKRPRRNDHPIGAPTTYVWRFEPITEGTTNIHFIKSFRGQTFQSIDFNIVVSPEKSDLQ